MGLFDIFKKKPVENNLQKNTTENDFEFFIYDVYFLKGRGVLIEGIIRSGLIRKNDTVAVNGKSVLVRGIKVKNALVEQTKASNETVALLLDEKESADCFKAGDILTAKQCAGTSSNTNTFICNVCGKELAIKYRHNNDTCVECKEAKKVNTPSAPRVWLPQIYNQFKDLANIDHVYGEKISSLITKYKSLYNEKAPMEDVNKAFVNLRNEVIRTLYIVPFHYDNAHEFQNDTVIHCTPKAANKFNIESIIYRCQNMTMDQMSKLYWIKDADTNILTVDLNWWDISRISGSDGFCFEDRKTPGTMYPRTGNDGRSNFFLCFTGIDQYLKVFGEDKNMHVALFTINDIVEYMSSAENFSGIIINPDTETHCFIGKEAF